MVIKDGLFVGTAGMHSDPSAGSDDVSVPFTAYTSLSIHSFSSTVCVLGFLCCKKGDEALVLSGCLTCSSLAWQPEEEMAETMAAVKKAQVCVVSLPLVNEWTQDRCPEGLRTPRWRGITALQELQHAGVSVAMASDNTRDQFYQYGDLDMLEVFAQGVRLGQLDRPISAWPASVTVVPAAAMHLLDMGKISTGGQANFVLFRARKFSELFSRPQTDRVRTGHCTCIKLLLL